MSRRTREAFVASRDTWSREDYRANTAALGAAIVGTLGYGGDLPGELAAEMRAPHDERWGVYAAEAIVAWAAPTREEGGEAFPRAEAAGAVVWLLIIELEDERVARMEYGPGDWSIFREGTLPEAASALGPGWLSAVVAARKLAGGTKDRVLFPGHDKWLEGEPLDVVKEGGKMKIPLYELLRVFKGGFWELLEAEEEELDLQRPGWLAPLLYGERMASLSYAGRPLGTLDPTDTTGTRAKLRGLIALPGLWRLSVYLPGAQRPYSTGICDGLPDAAICREAVWRLAGDTGTLGEYDEDFDSLASEAGSLDEYRTCASMGAAGAAEAVVEEQLEHGGSLGPPFAEKMLALWDVFGGELAALPPDERADELLLVHCACRPDPAAAREAAGEDE